MNETDETESELIFQWNFELFKIIYSYLSFRRFCCEVSHMWFLFLKFHIIVVRFLTYDFYFLNFILFLIVNKSAYIIKMVSDRLMQSAKYLKAGPNWENALLFFSFLSFLLCLWYSVVVLIHLLPFTNKQFLLRQQH